MPLTKYRANFSYAREELFALFACAQAGDVERGGRYDSRGGVLHVWSHPWSTQALRDESTLVGCIRISNGILPLPPRGKAMRPACFFRIPESTFCLFTEQMSSIVTGNSWYFHPLPAVCGGSYGASGSHLHTPGSQPHGALQSDRGAPGDLPRLVP